MLSGMVVFSIGLIVAFVYLVLHVWSLFGVLNLLAMSLLFTFFVFASKLLGFKRTRTESTIIYNPNEWPMVIGTLLGFGTIWYLYTVLMAIPDLRKDDYILGMAFLSLNVLEILKEVRQVLLQRNDQVIIEADRIQWVDFQKGVDTGHKLLWSDIYMIRPKGKLIEFLMHTKETVLLNPETMNMGPSFQLLQDILTAFDAVPPTLDGNADDDVLEEHP